MNKIPHAFIATNGVETPFLKVDEAFSETIYGQTLKRNVRWEKFKPAHSSNEEWEKLLGSDANNYRHLRHQYGLMRVFLERLVKDGSLELSQNDIEVLLLTPLVHDWAEAVVGDINFEYKTAAHEKKERTILGRQLVEVVPHLIGAETRAKILETTFESTTRLGQLFNITEKIGYFRTAINAWKRVNENPDQTNLDAVVTNVVGHNLGLLIELSKDFGPVDEYLRFHRDTINQVISHYSDYDFGFYPEQDRAKSRGNYQKATAAWEMHENASVADDVAPSARCA